jgi:hypothetical protein
MNFSWKKKPPLDCMKCEHFSWRDEKKTMWHIGCSPLTPKEEACLYKLQVVASRSLLNVIASPQNQDFRELQQKLFKLAKRIFEATERENEASDGNADWKERKDDIKKEIDDLLNMGPEGPKKE